MTFGYRVMINQIALSGHLGFGKYGGPNEHRLRRPQKMNLVCSGLHLCQISGL